MQNILLSDSETSNEQSTTQNSEVCRLCGCKDFTVVVNGYVTYKQYKSTEIRCDNCGVTFPLRACKNDCPDRDKNAVLWYNVNEIRSELSSITNGVLTQALTYYEGDNKLTPSAALEILFANNGVFNSFSGSINANKHDILGCPFCGCEPLVEIYAVARTGDTPPMRNKISCTQCGTYMHDDNNVRDLVCRWNSIFLDENEQKFLENMICEISRKSNAIEIYNIYAIDQAMSTFDVHFSDKLECLRSQDHIDDAMNDLLSKFNIKGDSIRATLIAIANNNKMQVLVCPHCGEKPKITQHRSYNKLIIECKNCNFTCHDEIKQSIQEWNQEKCEAKTHQK